MSLNGLLSLFGIFLPIDAEKRQIRINPHNFLIYGSPPKDRLCFLNCAKGNPEANFRTQLSKYFHFPLLSTPR